MKTIKLFALLFTVVLSVITYSCAEDDIAAPVITYPDEGIIIELAPGEIYDFIFTIDAEGGYSSHTLTADGGIASEKSSTPPQEAVNFTISGEFTAGNVAGPGTITLSVTDQNGKSATKSIKVTITDR